MKFNEKLLSGCGVITRGSADRSKQAPFLQLSAALAPVERPAKLFYHHRSPFRKVW
jgi:hypothetical protein